MIKGSIVVDRPIAAVFDYASHFEKHPEWQPELKAATFAGPLSVGAVGTETRKMGPQTSTYEFRVSECMPPQRIGFETTSGSVRPIGTMLFTSESEASTRVDFEMSMNPRGLLKVMGPLIERQAQKQTREHLQRFKQRMESPTS